MLKKDRSPTSNAILGAAVIFLVHPLIEWSIEDPTFDLVDWFWIGRLSSLIVMGIWARWAPLPPAIICLGMQLGMVAHYVFTGLIKTPFIAILDGGITLLLVIAVVTAVRRTAAT
jgi:hypothetical protein